MFQGTFTALVTPFSDTREMAVDFAALADLIEWQLECGINGFVLCGTTGEAATLETEEKLAIFERSKEIVRGRVPLIAGTGTNSTRYSIELTRSARKLGMDGALVISPYYNKPTQEGLYQHFRAVAVEGGLPVVVYNIPGRTSIDIGMETFARLAMVPEIVAVKEASGSIGKLMDIAEAVGKRMVLLAGDDNATLSTMVAGGKGVITASGNVIPKEMVAIVESALKGDWIESRRAQLGALPMMRALFVETNPAPAKAALAMMGKIPNDRVRLPLVGVKSETRAQLQKLLGLG